MNWKHIREQGLIVDRYRAKPLIRVQDELEMAPPRGGPLPVASATVSS